MQKKSFFNSKNKEFDQISKVIEFVYTLIDKKGPIERMSLDEVDLALKWASKVYRDPLEDDVLRVQPAYSWVMKEAPQFHKVVSLLVKRRSQLYIEMDSMRAKLPKWASQHKKAFLNVVSKIKKEVVEIQKNKSDKNFLANKAEQIIQDIETKGKKIGIPQAKRQTEILLKKNRYSLSDAGSLTKTLVTQGPLAMLDRVGFKRDSRLEKKAFVLEAILVLFCIAFLTLVFIVNFFGGSGSSEAVFRYIDEAPSFELAEGYGPKADAADFVQAVKNKSVRDMTIGEVEDLLEEASMFYEDANYRVKIDWIHNMYPEMHLYVKELLREKKNRPF